MTLTVTSARRALIPSILALCALGAPAAGDIFTRVAVLTGMQEVPANSSTAQGFGRFVIDTSANTVTYRIVYSGFATAEVGAHIHGAADPGVNAGVLHGLPAGPIKAGVWNYTEAQEADILGGKTYVNIHSAAFGGGEIRGQIVSGHAEMDGGQEVPGNASTARGFGLFNIDTEANTLRYYIAYAGLGSAETAAHIHGFSLPGTASGVQHGLPSGSPKVGVWNYPQAQEQAIIDGMTYVNIHTVGFGGGEIRGQIVFSVNPMDGGQEVGGVATNGAGGALVSLDRNSFIMGYDIRRQGMTSAETAAHIHGFAPPGANAGVLHTLPAGSPKRGTWSFGAGNFTPVMNALTYVNVHTVNFGGGELRGQINWPLLHACSPVVTSDPTSVTTTEGGMATFSVTADQRAGAAPTYEWRLNGSPVRNEPPYTGHNGPTLTINPATSAEAGSYDCVVTNPCGSDTSAAATLTIAPPNNCGTQDFNGDGDFGTDQDIEAFFACLAGSCCESCCTCGQDFNGDGDFGTDQDIESFFRVLAGAPC